MGEISIGDVKLDNPFVAAPLAGITDIASRTLYKEQGAALVYTEMVSGKGLIYGSENTEQLLKVTPEEKPVAYQIFGSVPEVIGETVRRLKGRDNDILDINMGCPVPKIVKNGEGSALLRDPDLVYRLVEIMVRDAGKPVTAKIRTGWSSDSVNCVEVAKAVAAAGASGIAVHGRTREQFYSGKADRAMIRAVKEAVDIPVMGNGDVFTGEDAVAMMDETGCDMVMIARGALGNPWIFRDAVALWRDGEKPEPPSKKEKADMICRHFDLIYKEKGERVAVNEIRKHIGWYFKGEPGVAALRRSVNQIKTARSFFETVEEYEQAVL